MSPSKLAAIMSSLGPGFGGKPPAKAPAPAPRPATRAAPGLSEKMRSETGKALESALGHDRTFTTGLEKIVKAASGLPTAQATSPHPLMAAARGLPGQAAALPGRAWGALKRPLGIGALGAAGAVAYGLHRQNVEDRENEHLVYAPMQGAMM